MAISGDYKQGRLKFTAFDDVPADKGINKHNFITKWFHRTIKFEFLDSHRVLKETHLNRKSAINWLKSNGIVLDSNSSNEDIKQKIINLISIHQNQRSSNQKLRDEPGSKPPQPLPNLEPEPKAPQSSTKPGPPQPKLQPMQRPQPQPKQEPEPKPEPQLKQESEPQPKQEPEPEPRSPAPESIPQTIYQEEIQSENDEKLFEALGFKEDEVKKNYGE